MGDDVTRFARQVAALAIEGLPAEIRPDKVSRWAGGWEHFRYYNLWYSRPPWTNYSLCHRVTFRPGTEPDTHLVYVRFYDEHNTNNEALTDLVLHPEQVKDNVGIAVEMGVDTLNDDFAHRIAAQWRHDSLRRSRQR